MCEKKNLLIMDWICVFFILGRFFCWMFIDYEIWLKYRKFLIIGELLNLIYFEMYEEKWIWDEDREEYMGYVLVCF